MNEFDARRALPLRLFRNQPKAPRTMSSPRIGLTMGDPAGIGPEIVLRALAALARRPAAAPVTVIGCRAALEAAAAALGLGLSGLSIEDIGPAPAPVVPGVAGAAGGEIAYRAIARAVEMALDGRIGASVTAPIAKEALAMAGHAYPGHTELLARLTGVSGPVMMLAHGAFRVSHLTTHIALRDVPDRLTPERLGRVIDLTHAALLTLGVAEPRIGVAALNPHAGEGGMFGREDIDVTEPLTARLRARGMRVEGPIPGDTVFVKMRAGQYDAVVAMYHDQGHVPVKLLGFDIDPATGAMRALSGVNVTLGLPIIRTSVDHGTAFDIAGKGVANADSLVEAIDYAVTMAARGALLKAG